MRFKADTTVVHRGIEKAAMTVDDLFWLVKADRANRFILVHKPTRLFLGYPAGVKTTVVKTLVESHYGLPIDWTRSDIKYYLDLPSDIVRSVFDLHNAAI